MLSFQVEGAPFPGGNSQPGVQRQSMTTATVPLEPLYQRGPRIDRADADIRSAQAEASASRQRLGLDAADAYYRVALAQVQVATTRDLVMWLDSVVSYNRVRAKEGATSEAELMRSELERDRMAAEEVMQRAELLQAQASLRAYLPESREFAVRMPVEIHDLPLPLPVTVSTTSTAGDAMSRRPDLRAARERTASYAAAVAAERSMLIRGLGATVGTMASAGMTSMIVGVSLPVPMFDANRGEIARAQAERDASQFELVAMERAATAQLQGSLDAAMLLTEQASMLARRDSGSYLARADESRRIALGAYREGAVPLLQVIDAARAWADARMTYYRLMFAQHRSVLDLIVAEGRELLAALPEPVAGDRGR
jgi:cobalt-zinc-cadmium efflux system outer membrane protein